MRRIALVPMVALLGLAACGESNEPPSGGPGPGRRDVPAAAPAPRIEGAGWLGATVDPAVPTGRVRVLAFFKPG
jgi:hypothetical protein